MHAELIVSGIIQGVGFRPFVYRTAVRNRLVGFVRNRGDAGVEIVIEGEEKDISQFIEDLRARKPPLAKIYDIEVLCADEQGEYDQFKILRSSEVTELSGSVIPTDVSVCDECLKELRDPANERYNYFFITCTDCGPRYTIINTLPYDRLKTTMRSFTMCNFCRREYKDPSNRRFHAQTLACKKCGPKTFLTSNDGQVIDEKLPIREAGKLLEEGYIVAIKGNGGFHIATSTLLSEPITRLRKVKHRSQKPLAIMGRTLESVKSFTEVSLHEAKTLASYIKPITLLRKSSDYYLSDQISPGLHNIGVMLPYTGLHVMLFDEVKEPAFVMTSGNHPSEPIIINNRAALKKLGSIVDFFLLHDRDIAQRCDDSVVRHHGERQMIIRRSRGFAPEPIKLKKTVNKRVLGLGSELNVVACLLLKDRAFLTQHVGDVDTLETHEFMKDTVEHLLRLTNSEVEAVACDLHPQFNTTRLAFELSEKLEVDVVPVQHHHAHLASLMAEHNVDEIVGIVCDGYGYGSDGAPWGGEIILGSDEGFKRLGALQEQPMVGGDLATRYPLRMAAGILHDSADIDEWIFSKRDFFPYGEKEIEVIIKQLENREQHRTTSCGRILDAISAVLGICYERTYEGEPAMKLESAALNGKDVLHLQPKLEREKVNTSNLVHEIFDLRDKLPVADLAYAAQIYLAKSLSELAGKEAQRLNIKQVGFSGGVAYNSHITKTIKDVTEANGLKFLVHNDVPPGDGGIAFGQTYFAAQFLS